LPVQHTDGAIELLRRGVEVYYLRRLTLLKKVRVLERMQASRFYRLARPYEVETDGEEVG
jgi:hypothetical protein